MSANKPYTIEICAASLASAQAAFDAGADRIELCSALSVGGLTPSYALLAAVRNTIPIPVHVLVRPREGDFLYSDAEFKMMQNEILQIKSMGFAGVVFGLLKADASIDEERTAALAALARPMKTTFHRAFDFVKEPAVALQKLIDLGFDYLLTSGLESTAVLGLKQIKSLVAQANNQIQIIPAAGINENNIIEIAKESQAINFHCSLSETVPSKMEYGSSLDLGFHLMESSSERIIKFKNALDQYYHA